LAVSFCFRYKWLAVRSEIRYELMEPAQARHPSAVADAIKIHRTQVA